MSVRIVIAAVALCLPTPLLAQSCPLQSRDYQARYERFHQTQDLVCHQKALERELLAPASASYGCMGSSKSYEEAFKRHSRSADLVCYQKALERELR